MKTLATFLDEAWEFHRDEWTPGSSHKLNHAEHTANIDGHHVHTWFHDTHLDHGRNWLGRKKVTSGHYEAAFSVNHSHAMAGVQSPETQRKVLHHVRQKIHQFIRHVRPRSIHFSSDDTTRQQLHRKLADHIAKQHDGTAHHDRPGTGNGTTSAVHFKQYRKMHE